MTRSTRRMSGLLGAGVLSVMLVAAVTSGSAEAATPARGGVASGQVASLAGTSMEVQDPTSGQTTVDWTGTTTFSQTVTEAVSALTAGECVTVIGTPAKKSKTTLAARSITVSAASSTGACTTGAAGAAGAGGFPGGGAAGRFGGGAGGGTPPAGGFGGGGAAGTRTGAGAGGAGRGTFKSGSFGFATGKVTAVSGSKVSVSGIVASGFTPPTKANAKKKTKVKAPKTQKLKITTSKTTTVSETKAAASTALVVGDCVSAFGPQSTTGAVTATTVRITSTGQKTCTTGFGGRGFGGGGGFGGGAPGGTGA
ncbi:MAG TPA: hypothetical protein VHV57_04480 [Acidimicrobiales bacterium]|nr:hypothetical protein [Acidimicrobiales bacterium]